jgi:uncharacterized membrane protein YdjX (TVP38/TMEM64 family)
MVPASMLSALIRLLENFQQMLDGMGGWAVLAFAVVFVGVQLMMLPGAPLGIAAGFFFGFGKGWLALTLGCMLGATLNFWIARSLARGWVQRKFGENPKFRVIDRAIEREGWKIVALLRFVPIPFGLANYSYGLSPVRYVPYILATFFAIIPANSLLVWIGSESQGELATILGKGRPRHPMEYVLLIAGIVAAILALRHITKIARSTVARTGEIEVET